MRSFLLATILAVALPAIAQPLYQVTPALTYGAKDATKKERVFPIFWSAARKVFPPLPFNPFPELPVYDAGNHNLIYDDREVDYPALEAAMAKERATAEAEAAALEKDAGGGGMALRSSSSSTNLTLAMPVFDGTNLQLTIENGVAGEFYDLFYSTNLVDWLFLVRTDLDQFNFSITPPAWPFCFFRLGTQQDTDDDTLTDAYEALITQTSASFPNTLQNLNQLTNLTVAQFITLSNNLIDHPPVLEMERYERDYSDLFLNSACAFPSGNHFDSYSEQTRWTNNVGGFFTNSAVWNYCVNSVEVYTNYQREGRIAADVFGTNYYRSRVNNGAWSAWTEDWIGAVPTPGALLYDRTYSLTVETRTNGTTPLETFRVTDSTTAKMRYHTGGLPFSTARRLHRIAVGGWEYNPDGTSFGVPQYLFRFPNLSGNPIPNSGGVAYALLADNTTNDVTPSLQSAHLTNYVFTLSAQRELIQLNFRSGNNEFLTGPDGNGGGYDEVQYNHWIQYCETNLGVLPTIVDGTAAQRGSNWMNVEEISATVPLSTNFVYAWHQDKQRTRYLWTPSATNVVETDPYVSFSTQGPSGGNDTSSQTLYDPTPDSLGNVYFPDAPALTITDPVLVNAPVGSVAALRFYGHTWLTVNGNFASSIVNWRTFITIKKTTNGWIRVGTNNFIGLTPAGTSENPTFTVGEASGL